jgi:RNA recognition motif-containing protein
MVYISVLGTDAWVPLGSGFYPNVNIPQSARVNVGMGTSGVLVMGGGGGVVGGAELVQVQESPPAGCDPDAIKLFVGNIPKLCTEEQLQPFFETIGKVFKSELAAFHPCLQLQMCTARSYVCMLRHDYCPMNNFHVQPYEQIIKRLLSNVCMQVVELVIVKEKSTHESKGSAFLWYATRIMAERAILQFNLRHVLPDPSGEQDRPLVVRKAKARVKQSIAAIVPHPSAVGMLPGLPVGQSQILDPRMMEYSASQQRMQVT